MIFRTDVLDTIDRALAFVVSDIKSGEIVYVSRSLEVMFGYMTMNELVGKNVDLLVPKDKREVHKTHRAKYAADPTVRPMGVGMQLEGCKRNGSTFPLIVTIVPAVISGTPCAIAVVVDLTPQ